MTELNAADLAPMRFREPENHDPIMLYKDSEGRCITIPIGEYETLGKPSEIVVLALFLPVFLTEEAS